MQPRKVRPTASSVDEERLWRKRSLAAAFRLFADFGFDEGVAGHITARDPELTDHLILVDSAGTVVEGEKPVNLAAFAVHSQIHEARPDVVAAAHAHSLHGKALSSLDQRIDPITQDACVFDEDHGVFDDFNGLVFDGGRR